MPYSPDDFLALLEEVERQGGAHDPDPCIPREFKIELPDASGKKRTRRAHTTGCGRDSIFIVPYEPAGKDAEERRAMRARKAGFARVCANDDLVGHWPRFAGIIALPDPEQEEADAD